LSGTVSERLVFYPFIISFNLQHTLRKARAMSLFAVSREAGPAWIDGKGAFEQPAVNDHAAFMNKLADEGLCPHGWSARWTRAGTDPCALDR
jgi:hypothetical protein